VNFNNDVNNKQIADISSIKIYRFAATGSNGLYYAPTEIDSAVPYGNAYILSELQRRFAFEFGGMRNHEYYFSSFEDGSKALPENSELRKEIENTWGSFDAFISRFKAVAMTRGVGWAMLYYDKQTNNLLTQWVDEQHLGHLVSCSPVLCLDMWEHAFVYDYPTSEKKKYVEAFFENLNWEKIEKNFLRV